MAASFHFGVISDEISQEVEDAIRIAKDYGLEALELRSLDGMQLYQLSDARIGEIEATIHAAGLKVCGLSSPVFKCHLQDEEEVTAHRKMLGRYAELAHRLGTRHIRGFSFWADGSFEEFYDDIVRELRAIVPVLQEHGVIFALEPDPAVFASNAAKVAAVVREVNSPHVQGLYDPGNDLWDPDGEIPYPAGYEALRGSICHIHLKDAVRSGEHTEAVAIGKGQVDYTRLLHRLVEDRYEGYLVVETHYRLHSSLSEEQLKRPAGYAFSEGGEEATVDCLNSLFDLLRQNGFEYPEIKRIARKGGAVMAESRLAEKKWWKDRLQVRQYESREGLGKAAAADVSTAMKAILADRGSLRMVFAAAPSQNEFLIHLAKDPEIDWNKVTVFHMDEYIGLDPDAPQLFSTFLDTRLFSRVAPGAVHLINGSADPEKECERYASLLQEAPIDIVCLGIGENGHLAFNDPPVADFEDPKTVKVVQLDDMCREQQVRDGCFDRFREVPEYAMTMTIPALLSASRLFCIVPGPSKRNAVRQTLEGPVSAQCPASILRRHPSCILYVDRDSCDGYPASISADGNEHGDELTYD